MKRCKHHTGTVIEVMLGTHARSVENGIMEGIGYNNVGNITHYEYRCFDCGKWFVFRTWGKYPKWFQKFYNELHNPSAEDKD